jgi:outer membrane murein-binding lipoprotein Lpp
MYCNLSTQGFQPGAATAAAAVVAGCSSGKKIKQPAARGKKLSF